MWPQVAITHHVRNKKFRYIIHQSQPVRCPKYLRLSPCQISWSWSGSLNYIARRVKTRRANFNCLKRSSVCLKRSLERCFYLSYLCQCIRIAFELLFQQVNSLLPARVCYPYDGVDPAGNPPEIVFINGFLELF